MDGRRKQLCVLLAVACWVTFAVVWWAFPTHKVWTWVGDGPCIRWYDWEQWDGSSYKTCAEFGGHSEYHYERLRVPSGQGGLLGNIIAYSLPGVCFGSALFWWFGRRPHG
jgi:hypothetical protein